MIKFDYISDLHVDHWVNKSNGVYLENFVKSLLPEEKSEILVIAGDIGHKNRQNGNVLKYLREHYSHIIVVHGNHDLYIVYPELLEKYNNNSFNRLEEFIDICNEIEGVHFLDGDSIEINGITFGGACGWFDSSFAIEKHFLAETQIDDMFMRFSDCKYIFTPNKTNFDWREYSLNQKKKLERLSSKVDVMITHYVPTFINMRPLYYSSPFSTFFHFDGKKLLEEMQGKVWVHGHTHDEKDHEVHGCHILCNPFGYPNENYQKGIEFNYDPIKTFQRS